KNSANIACSESLNSITGTSFVKEPFFNVTVLIVYNNFASSKAWIDNQTIIIFVEMLKGFFVHHLNTSVQQFLLLLTLHMYAQLCALDDHRPHLSHRRRLVYPILHEIMFILLDLTPSPCH